MNTTDFINALDETRLKEAISQAEARTSGEIRVFISQKKVEDPVTAATDHFVRLGMTKTAERNGVLIFVAPASQAFAVIGDQGIHEKCGQPFWDELKALMQVELQSGKATDALEKAVLRCGQLLSVHFPRRPDDVNELPDAPEHD